MELNANQQDVLAELINIGYGRAAGVLSELIGHRVLVEVPNVSLHTIREIGPILESALSPQVANINQTFSGVVSGNALLLMNEASALVLSKLVGGNITAAPSFDDNAKEIISEVGNIVLNACLGVLGNLLQIQVTFTVPRFEINSVTRVMNRALDDQPAEFSHGLLVHTRFHVKSVDLSGYLLVALGIDSLARLLIEIEKWEQRQFV